MRGQRVIFINRFYYPDHSATAQILTDLARHLAAKGWDVHVIASRTLYADPSAELAARETVDGVKVRRAWTSRFGRRTTLGRIADYLSFYPTMFFALLALARRGDIVVVKTDPPLVSVAAAVAGRMKGARLINWLQDLYPEVAAQLGMTALRGPVGGVLRALRNASLKAASANVVIGRRMAQRLIHEGVASDRIALVHNWSDDDVIVPGSTSGNPVREGWGFTDEDFVVGYSGNLGQAHEVDTLIEAARLLGDAGPVKFLFIGGGKHTEGLGAKVEELGLRNFVFQPYQPREKLSLSLGAPDIHWLSLRPQMEGLIVPSKFYGIAAAGRGAIVIGARDGELAHLVERHEAGYAIETGDAQALADAIAALAADRAACRDLGARARHALDNHFPKRRSLEQWEKILADVAQDRAQADMAIDEGAR